MLKNRKFRILLCLLTALTVLLAFCGCGDSSTDDENDADSSQTETEEATDSVTLSGSGDDLSLGLGSGDTYISREDYELLGDYYYVESYHIETTDGDMTELGLDMYLTYDEENGYSDPDGVLAIYYDSETGEITSYEAYVGISPIRATVTYRVGNDCSYFTCCYVDSNSITTEVLWDNYVYNSETGVTTYYTGTQTYYSASVTERIYEEQYIVSDDGTLTLSQIMTKEYDEDGNLTLDETVEYDEDGNEIAS